MLLLPLNPVRTSVFYCHDWIFTLQSVQDMKLVTIAVILAWIDFARGLNFADWSLKFAKPKKRSRPSPTYLSKFYDPKWAFFVMDLHRHHKPNIDSECQIR